MSVKNYLIVPDGCDGCDLPITPEPVALSEVSATIERWLAIFETKGQPYFSNAKMERIPLDALAITLIPCELEEEPEREVGEWNPRDDGRSDEQGESYAERNA